MLLYEDVYPTAVEVVADPTTMVVSCVPLAPESIHAAPSAAPEPTPMTGALLRSKCRDVYVTEHAARIKEAYKGSLRGKALRRACRRQAAAEFQRLPMGRLKEYIIKVRQGRLRKRNESGQWQCAGARAPPSEDLLALSDLQVITPKKAI